MRRIYILTILIALTGIFSCKKLATVDPPTTSIVSATVFSDNASATAAVTGIYSRMIGGSTGNSDVGVYTGGFASGNTNSLTFFGSLSADELVNYPSSGTANSFYFYGNKIPPANTSNFWAEIYQYIYTANAGIEGLADSSSAVSPALKAQLTGECKFIRGFCYFYLTNLFGSVPLITTTDYLKNQYASQATRDVIYTQVLSDLQDAENLLGTTYDGGERIRPIKWAATALLARTYLYTGKWADAEREASNVINSGQYDLSDLSAAFLKNSSETIWALRPSQPNQNTPDALTFFLTAPPISVLNNVTILNKLLNTFEPGDKRRTTWIDSLSDNTNTYYFPAKYRALLPTGSEVSEYSIVLRYAEQWLIRAEARAQQNNLPGAIDDLDVIRGRAGLGVTTASTQAGLLSAILHERQTELFTEWGHRWLDIKRTNSADSVMQVACPLKGTQWATTAQLWPIPLSELQADHNLVQNLGYK